jgi:hypothetical protein
MSTPKPGKQYSSSILAPPLDTSDRLAKISHFYHQEAERCARGRAYLAACVLAAAALEAILLSMCYIEDRKVRSTSVYKRRSFRSKRNRFLEFSLFQLIEVAAELNWISRKEIKLDRRKTTLKELMHGVRNTRNQIHPGVWAKEGGPHKVYRRTYAFVYDVFDITREWLLQGVELSIRQQMHREGILIKD